MKAKIREVFLHEFHGWTRRREILTTDGLFKHLHNSQGKRRIMMEMFLDGSHALTAIGRVSVTAAGLLAAAFFGVSAWGQPGPGIVGMVISPRPESPAMAPTGQVAVLIGELADEASPSAIFHPPSSPPATALLAMGPAIEPQLRGALQHIKPAVTFPYVQPLAGYSNIFILDPDLLSAHGAQYALEVVRSHLDEQGQSQGSVVTLHYRDAPLTNVLADFGRQIDAEVSAGSVYLRPLDWIKTNRVTVNFDRLNYWQAIQKLNQQARLSEIYENLNRPLLIQAGQGMVSPTVANRESVVSGPIEITPVAVELARRLDDDNGDNSARVTLTLAAQAEPKFWNSGEHAMVRLDECIDDRGQSLLLAGATNFLSQGEGCYWSWEVPVEFRAPARGRRVKTLKGRFNVALCMDQRFLTITNLMHAQGQSCEFDGIRLTVRKMGDGFDGSWREMVIEVSAPTGSPYANRFADPTDLLNVSVFDESQKMIFIERITGAQVLERVDIWDEFRGYPSAPHGPRAAFQFGEIRHEAGREVIAWRGYFSNKLTPATLIWLTPPETRWLPVPFELHDVPMP
jgi:hypothetical protein